MAKGLMSFFSTLQYSITPVLQDRDFQEFLVSLKLAFYWSEFRLFNLIIGKVIHYGGRKVRNFFPKRIAAS